MKRKLTALLTALMLLALMVTPAFADLIIEPNNSFYERHRDECVYHDRGYIANGEKGYVTVLTAPDSVGDVYTNSKFLARFVSEVTKNRCA